MKASSISESNAAAEELSLSISLPSAESSCFKTVTTSVSASSACENNRNADGEDKVKCERPQSVPDSSKAGRPENVLINATDTLPIRHSKHLLSTTPTINTKLIRPLYKYIENNKCLLCGFESKSKDLYRIRTHLFVHVTSKEFKCDICDKEFRTMKHLINHSVIHQDACPYSCDLCDKKYRTIYRLRNHKRKKHRERPKFKCDFCNKIFTSNFVLRSHISIHTGERPFECDVCNKSFRLRQYLMEHLRRHDGADKTQRVRQCDQSSHDSVSSSAMVSATSESNIDPDVLSTQVLSLLLGTNFSPLSDSVSTSIACENIHNMDGEMCTQICDVPQSGAESPKARSENSLRIDTLDTVGECDNICIKNRNVIRPLYKYIKNNKCLLCGFQSKSKNLYAVRAHLFVHVTNKQYNCDTCDKKFPSLFDLKRHRDLHNDVSKLSCDLCGKKYLVSSSLRSHKKYKHGERRKF